METRDYCINYKLCKVAFGVYCALYFVCVCFLFITKTLTLTEKSPPPPYSAAVNPRNEFSFWWCLVGDTLKSISKHNHCITRSFPQDLFYLPPLISDSFHSLSSPVYDITLLFLPGEGYYTLRTSVPVCCSVHTAVSVLSAAVRSEHPLASQAWPGFWPHNLQIQLHC